MNAIQASGFGKLILSDPLALADCFDALAHDPLDILLQSIRLWAYAAWCALLLSNTERAMNCKECGQTVDSVARFCQGCGRTLDVIPAHLAKRHGFLYYVGVVFLVFVCLSIIGYIVQESETKPPTPAEDAKKRTDTLNVLLAADGAKRLQKAMRNPCVQAIAGIDNGRRRGMLRVPCTEWVRRNERGPGGHGTGWPIRGQRDWRQVLLTLEQRMR